MSNYLYTIYSVWTKGYWLDDLEDNKQWIYIYKNSLLLLEGINNWDSILFFQSWIWKWKLFTFCEKKYTEWDDYWYIIINKEDEYDFDITIWDFKNLSFINFDSINSWVRSPLATKNNILKLVEKDDILEWFTEYSKLKEIFSEKKYYDYIRKYKITFDKEEIQENNYKNTIYCLVENNKFSKEFSYFCNWEKPDKWINFWIDFDKLKEIFKNKTQNLSRLNEIINNKELELYTYPSYYDLTRVNNNNENNSSSNIWLAISKNNNNEEINNIDDEIVISKLESHIEELSNKIIIFDEKIKEAKIRENKANEREKKADEKIKEAREELGKIRSNNDLEYALNISAIEKLGYIQKLKVDDNVSIIKKSWYKKIFNRWWNKVFQYILPAIRVWYLWQWKDLVIKWKNKEDEYLKEEQIEKRAKELKLIINKFDEVLEEEQNREQKNIILTKLLWFFWIQFVILFIFLIINWNTILDLEIDIDKWILQVIVWATILQVTSMLWVIVYKLYPVNKKDNADNKKDDNNS